MHLVLVALASLGAALLTLFSGFGLGSLLLPVFALFFPLAVAVAATAVVHLANNLFKVMLLGRHARAAIVVRFGVPAAVAAFAGAAMLARLSRQAPLASYTWRGTTQDVTLIGLVLGTVIGLFALFELLPVFDRLRFGRRWMALGGALSGFFGGLSGHQGALRAAFLAKTGLDRDAFLGTSVVCAVIVDVARLATYGASSFGSHGPTAAGASDMRLLIVATLAAFAGSFAGTRLVRKVTMRALQRIIGIAMLVLAAGIATGWV
jgi:hypothetical protein